VKEKC